VTDFPRSLIEFQRRFSDEAACVKYLFTARGPQGFVCPGCGKGKAWERQTIARNLASGAPAKTDGWSAYPGAPSVPLTQT
jgi:hypothetical protein